MRRPYRLALLALILVAPSCGGDDFAYEGTPGTPVAADFDGWVPTIRARIDGGDEHTFLVDTGAPFTILDNQGAYAGLEAGKLAVRIDAFGLGFADYPVVAMDMPGDGLDGILGGDLVSHFALSIDYLGARLWLSDPFDPGAVPADVDVETDVALPFATRGGGLSLVPCPSGSSCGVMEVPPTRILLRAYLEAETAPVWVMVDSGASAVVLDYEDFVELGGVGAGRPVLEGVTVATMYGEKEALLSRLWGLRLVGATGEGVEVQEEDVPVLVIPGDDMLVYLSQEVGKDVRALIGGTLLRYHLTTIDYQEERLHLASYRDPAHVPPNEFVGVGFEMQPVDGTWIIQDVYTGTDAAAEGLARGQVVEEIGATPITGVSAPEVWGLMEAYQLGQEVPVGVRGATGVEVKNVLVEDLLPSYPRP